MRGGRRAAIGFFSMALFMAAGFARGEAPNGWTTYSQRADIAPRFQAEPAPDGGAPPALVAAGRGAAHVNGEWRKVVPVEAGRTYRFSADYVARHVELQRRSVVACVEWLGAEGPRADQFEYPPTVAPSAAGADGRTTPGRIEGFCTAPKGASQAQLALVFRWDGDGEVRWSKVEFVPAERPKRPVRLATIYCRPRNSKSPEASVEAFARLVRQAASQKPDFICLPEGITIIGTGKSYIEVAEPAPGPTTEKLGVLARESNAYLVAGIYERVGPTVYNTAVLIGRDGRLIGGYRKAALPNEEIAGGITPGEEFPVFETEFGKVGLMICWDVFFPEPARALAAQGAEIVFLPIWGGNADLIKARPIENQVFLVTSSYDAKTAVYNREGRVLAEANAEKPIALAEVDLAETTRWEWLGDFRGRIPREAPPLSSTAP